MCFHWLDIENIVKAAHFSIFQHTPWWNGDLAKAWRHGLLRSELQTSKGAAPSLARRQKTVTEYRRLGMEFTHDPVISHPSSSALLQNWVGSTPLLRRFNLELTYPSLARAVLSHNVNGDQTEGARTFFIDIRYLVISAYLLRTLIRGGIIHPFAKGG
jgi:hypothetical protein